MRRPQSMAHLISRLDRYIGRDLLDFSGLVGGDNNNGPVRQIETESFRVLSNKLGQHSPFDGSSGWRLICAEFRATSVKAIWARSGADVLLPVRKRHAKDDL